MFTTSFKQRSQTLLAVITAFALLLAQPLCADETSAPTQEEESVFQTLKRKTRELFKSDPPANEAQKETPAPTEDQPQEESTSQKSDGRKVINTFKKEMNKISGNVSESVERDKKTLKQKFNKLTDKK